MDMEYRITNQKDAKVNDADRLELAALLIKFGYTVRIGKERHEGNKQNTIYVAYKAEK
jgi:hypothetical protein